MATRPSQVVPSLTTSGRSSRVGAAVLLALSLLLGACGSDGDSASTGSDHNDADVAFATEMIPHHAQALEMVEMAEGRKVDPEVRSVMDAIAEAQEPEIATMRGWLEEWGEKVPPTDGSMAGMDGMDDGMEGMDGMGTGMMSEADMTSLEQASERQFQSMWLRMMIAHHEGAIAMAREEKAEGESPEALELADSIISSQQVEIREMTTLLEG